ncbi:MAG: histidine kinase [Cyclobacteriaceae bacterium]
MKRYGIIILVVSFLGTAIFSYLFYSEYGVLPKIENEPGNFLLSAILAILSAILVSFVDKGLNKIINWKNFFFTRFIAGFIGNVAAVSALLAGIVYLIVWVNNFEASLFYQQWHEEIWKLGILTLIILFIYEVFYGWLYSYRYFATTQVEELKSERWQMELQFESLKSQISPHYLFNCLNTISSLLYKDSHVAEEFIRRMADTFRYVMSNQQRKLVTLAEELTFVRSYYYLMQVRYQDHLKLDINIPSRLMDSMVPPLAIQMLLENAVKHNEISKNHPLFIYISAQDNTLINISSTKTIASNAQSLNVGLANIRNRYKFFTREKIVVKDIDKFVVQLPVIKATTNSHTQYPSVTNA